MIETQMTKSFVSLKWCRNNLTLDFIFSLQFFCLLFKWILIAREFDL